MIRLVITLLVLSGAQAFGDVTKGDLLSPCGKALSGQMDYGEFRKIVPEIRRKLFENRHHSLPELKPLIVELQKKFILTAPESESEVARYLAGLGAPQNFGTPAASLIPEFLHLREILFKNVQTEIEALVATPELITYDRYSLVGYRASMAMTRLPDTLTLWSIQLMVFKLRQEMQLLGIPELSPDAMVLADWERSSYPGYRQQFEHVTAAGPTRLFLWSLRNFTIEDIVDADDDQVDLAENIPHPNNVADNVLRNSSNFFDHDINHAHMNLKHDNELNWNSPIRSEAQFESVRSARIRFKHAVRDSILAEDADLRIYYGMWYEIFHERLFNSNGTIATPQSVLSFEASISAQQSQLLSALSSKYSANYHEGGERAKQMAEVALRNLFLVARRLAGPG